MSRLRKKCLIVSTGMHLLLLLVVVFGVAFATSPKPEPQEPILTLKLEADPVAQPLPQPVQQQQLRNVQPQPVPPTPRVNQNQRKPEPQRRVEPKPRKPEPVISTPRPKKNTTKPKPKPSSKPKPKPKPRKINVSSKVVERTVGGQKANTKPRTQNTPKPRSVKVDTTAADKLRQNLSGKTQVNFRANSSTYNRYKDVVASVYQAKWNRGLPPKSASYRGKVIRVRVTVSKTGRVISARIVGRSGMVALDSSVQATLNAVRSIGQPFPPGVRESQQTFTINFQDKR